MSFTLVPMACPVCGGNQPRAFRPYRLVRRRSMPVLRDWLEKDLTIATCGNCGHHYLNPAPDEASFEAYYADDYFSADTTSPANQQQTLTAADGFFFEPAGILPSGADASSISAAETGSTCSGAPAAASRPRALTVGTTPAWRNRIH